MSTCPVCGKPADEAAPSSQYKGKAYYFACPPCKDRFDENPERYVTGGPQPHGGHGHDHEHHH